MLFGNILLLCLVSVAFGQKKTRLFVVSSYHREYLWSKDTHAGVCAGLLDFKFVDNKAQIEEYTANDYLETDNTVVKKVWMDSKRKNAKKEIAQSAKSIIEAIGKFMPDLIFLGDDNAANYVGNHFIDAVVPVIFWGVDINPMKYGLIESIESPGHNVTGVYQTGYTKESLEYFKQLVPAAETFVTLADDSETGRAWAKQAERLSASGKIPLKLLASVVTNSFTEWKAKALEYQNVADAFLVVNHSTMKDEHGSPVDQLHVCSWYLKNIKKPECTIQKQFVHEGLLLAADDSGYKQGYEAVRKAHQILHEKKNPAEVPVIAPTRGALMVNRHRAEMLGIDLPGKTFIEEIVEKALAMENCQISR